MATRDRAAFLRSLGLTEDDLADTHGQPPPPRGVARTHAYGDRAATHGAGSRDACASAYESCGLGLGGSSSMTATTSSLSSSAGLSSAEAASNSDGSFATTMTMTMNTTAAVPTARSSARLRAMHGIGGSSSSSVPAATAAVPSLHIRTPDDCKQSGNVAFERGSFVEAIRHYTEGIDTLKAYMLCSSGSSSGGQHDYHPVAATAPPRTSQQQAQHDLLAALYSNRSAAYLQAAKQLPSLQLAYAHALSDAEEVVALRPEWCKGYARVGDVYFKTTAYERAAEMYATSLRLQPDNATVVRALAESQARAHALSAEKRRERQERRERAKLSDAASTPPPQQAQQQQQQQAYCRSSSSSSSNKGRGTVSSTHATTPTTANERSGNAREMWRELKSAVEATTHELTGDDYRRQQLERFRQQRERSGSNAAMPAGNSSSSSSTSNNDSSDRGAQPPTHHDDDNAEATREPAAPTTTAAAAQQARRASLRSIPEAFSSSAATAYQQRLLEEYRKKKALREAH